MNRCLPVSVILAQLSCAELHYLDIVFSHVKLHTCFVVVSCRTVEQSMLRVREYLLTEIC